MGSGLRSGLLRDSSRKEMAGSLDCNGECIVFEFICAEWTL
jgi:hypothetical protein